MKIAEIKNNLLKKIKSKKIKVAIIGLGYVGLPLAISFVKRNVEIIGFDIDRSKISNLKKNNSYLHRIGNKEIKKMNDKKSSFYSDFRNVSLCDIIIVCVPTPITKNNKPDLSFVKNAFISIKPYLKKGQILIIESTNYPGSTRELFFKNLNKKFNVGEDFFLGFSSERINPGFNENKIEKVPKVVSGFSKNCLELISKFYALSFKKVVNAKSLEVAEFSKLLENIYRSVNIGFINEMKIIADKMNLDIFDIIDIANTKPFGFRAFHPGPGVGGHCIPIDPHYLNWKAKKIGVNAKFITLSSKINFDVMSFILKKINICLKKKKVNFNEAKILIIGASYKKNIDDYRESSSLRLLKKLIEKRIKKIDYYDSYLEKVFLDNNKKIIKKSIKLKKNTFQKYDISILMTDHDNLDYKKIYQDSKCIIDCRGRFKVDKKVIRA